VFFIHKTADGQTLRAQDKRGALAISPTIVWSIYYQSDVASSGGVRVEGGELGLKLIIIGFIHKPVTARW